MWAGAGGRLEAELVVVETFAMFPPNPPPAQCQAASGFGEGENSSWELGAPDPQLLISDP